MKKLIFVVVSFVLPLLFIFSCNSGTSADDNSISADSATIAKGEMLFSKNCSSCHNFKADGIGPNLIGITTEVSAGWLLHFIKNPAGIINSGDKHANELYKKYKAMMPSFALNNNEMRQLFAFLDKQKGTAKKTTPQTGKELADPIPAKIQNSGLVV